MYDKIVEMITDMIWSGRQQNICVNCVKSYIVGVFFRNVLRRLSSGVQSCVKQTIA